MIERLQKLAFVESEKSLRLRVNFGAGLIKLAGLLFHTSLECLVLRQLLFRRIFSYVLRDFHGTEVRTAHAAEVCGLGAFLWKRLMKLMPIIFTRSFAGLAVYVASTQSAPFIMV